MYVIKVKGNSSISDFIQIRDEDFTLIAYFKAKNPLLGIKKNNMEKYKKEIMYVVENTDYGKIVKI